MSRALPLSRAEAWRLPGGLSISGALSLLAVAAVLVVVSVPRLRDLAVAENEADARATAQLLASTLRASPKSADGRGPSLRELLRRPELDGALEDSELLERGTLLRRRGYLFEVTRLAPVLSLPSTPASLLCGESGGLHGMPAIRAWPWAHGTGEASFLVTAAGATLVLPDSSPDALGLGAAGADLGPLEGWRRAP